MRHVDKSWYILSYVIEDLGFGWVISETFHIFRYSFTLDDSLKIWFKWARLPLTRESDDLFFRWETYARLRCVALAIADGIHLTGAHADEFTVAIISIS